MKKQSGITLVALVVTVIILSILAGTTITLLKGNNGIISKTDEAVVTHNKAKAQEDITTAWTTMKTKYLANMNKPGAKSATETFTAENLNATLKGKGVVTNFDCDEEEGIYTFKYIVGNETYSMIISNNEVNFRDPNAPTIQKYSIIYDAKGGENAPLDGKKYKEGESVAVNLSQVPTRTGRTFLGWANSADATTPDYTLSGTTSFTMGNANKTLYAVWNTQHATCTDDTYFGNIYNTEGRGSDGLIQVRWMG